ncbi:2OG-Fe(II) oxygenase [Rugosimonospora africana]|uniref:Prolyl 4-hydroxylase alpha subunit Fe(2+) 2OG dioxygenase domain-containing protein n=1 Tax=Rugosimonospora africana TaxID=556532 RepID=A0A8J3VR42_9ACTN|nr:2OG-Fe(II) oxygenase [Rugosimonospora africana]GIH15013.1 hypothetical protein Raf01_31850 [Rugosimonospora africana]
MTSIPRYKSDEAVVYDDVLPADQFAALFRYLNGVEYASVHAQRWHKVWRLTDGNPLTAKAGWYHPRPVGRPRTPRYPTGTPLDRLVDWIVARVPDVASVVGNLDAWEALSFAPWIYPAGSGLSLHQDGARYTGAFTYFAHPHWKLHWGGHLMVLDPQTPRRDLAGGELMPAFLNDDDETARVFDPGLAQVILPRPNRIVFISPTAQHVLTKVDASAGQAARVSVAGFFHKPATRPQAP